MPDEAPPLTDFEVQSILSFWSNGLDTCTDEPELFTYQLYGHTCGASDCGDRSVELRFHPPIERRLEAEAYIRVLAAEYPFQLQKAYAMDRYHVFLDVFAATKNMRLAMRAI